MLKIAIKIMLSVLRMSYTGKVERRGSRVRLEEEIRSTITISMRRHFHALETQGCIFSSSVKGRV